MKITLPDPLPEGLACVRETQGLRFVIADYGQATVTEKDGVIELFPERSSSHRALKAKLQPE